MTAAAQPKFAFSFVLSRMNRGRIWVGSRPLDFHFRAFFGPTGRTWSAALWRRITHVSLSCRAQRFLDSSQRDVEGFPTVEVDSETEQAELHDPPGTQEAEVSCELYLDAGLPIPEITDQQRHLVERAHVRESQSPTSRSIHESSEHQVCPGTVVLVQNARPRKTSSRSTSCNAEELLVEQN